MIEVSFPGLGIGPFQFDGVAFTLFGLDVAWYGVFITVGMLLAFVYCMHKAKYEGIKSDDMLDLGILIVILCIIGARLYYVIFELESFIVTNGNFFENVWHSFLKIVNIRDGGLAIYGGVIGGFIAALIISKRKKIRFPILLDTLVGGLLIGQIIGRWGNFVNGEAFGYETPLPWGMNIKKIAVAEGLSDQVFPVESGLGLDSCVHPTFFYESMWNLIGFLLITVFYKKKKFHGQHFAFYLVWYGLGRAVIEGLRTDSLWLFGENSIRVSQALGIVTVFIGAVLFVFGFLKAYKKIDVWANIRSKLSRKG